MKLEYIKGIPIFKFEKFPEEKICQFVTTIQGGVSSGNYMSMNLGEYCGDKTVNVQKNRALLADVLGVNADEIVNPFQTHGTNIQSITENWFTLSTQDKSQKLNSVDAIITDQKGIFISVTTADCVPILIFDPVKNVIASIHAGWKGTIKRIASKTISRLIAEYDSNPCDLIVGMGPSISPEKFEVGEEVGDKFIEEGFDLSSFSFRNHQTGKLHVDLWKANYNQLLDMLVLPDKIEISGLCTYSNPDRFFSARRQGIHSGRMLTGGMLL